MKYVFRFFVAILRFLYQSIHLAAAQIWANKMRAMLTTLGIVIGVASVTAVIAALTGLKAKVLDEFENIIGSNSIFVQAYRPDHGPHRHVSYRLIRLSPGHFTGLLEHCPSVESFTRVIGPAAGGFVLGALGTWAPGDISASIMIWVVIYVWRRLIVNPDPPLSVRGVEAPAQGSVQTQP